MADVYPLVYHRDHGPGGPGHGVPRFRRVSVSVRRPGLSTYGLGRVVQTPELVEARVVGGRRREDLEVRLRVLDGGRGLVALHGLPHPDVLWQVHQVHVAAREVLLRLRIGLPVQGGEVGLRRVLLEPDNHLSRYDLAVFRSGKRRMVRASLGLGLHLLGRATVSGEADQSRYQGASYETYPLRHRHADSLVRYRDPVMPILSNG